MTTPVRRAEPPASNLRPKGARLESHGGAAPDASDASSTVHGQTSVLLTNAELAQLQVRVIALENLVTALLAAAPSSTGALVGELAGCILPRAGCTPHHLTIHASAHMIHLAQRSELFRSEAAPVTQHKHRQQDPSTHPSTPCAKTN